MLAEKPGSRRLTAHGLVFLVLFFAISSVAFYFLFSVFSNVAFAQFVGPNCAAGQCAGAIGVDAAHNVSVGTSTPLSSTKFLIVASSSGDTSNYSLKILYPNQQTILFVRNDGSVGIATSSPGAGITLDVVGTIRGTTLMGSYSGTVNAANVSAGVFASSTGSGNFAFPGSLYISTSSQAGPSVGLAVYTTSTFYGNVGIGTTGPGAPLEVRSLAAYGTAQNTIIVDGDISGGVSSDPAYYGAIKFTGSNYDWGAIRTIQTNPSLAWTSRLSFWTMNGNGGALTERMAIDNSGNVGIGTTNPNATLNVSGTLAISGNINSSSSITINGVAVSTSTGGSSQWTSASGGIYYPSRVSVGTTTLNTYALLVATSSDNLFAIKREGATYPTIFKQGTDGALVINNSSTDTLTLKSGNVGIGTTSPGALLDITTTGYFPTGIGLRVSFYGPNLADFLTTGDIPGKVRISGGATSNGRSGLEVYNFNPTAAADAIYGEFKAGYDGSWTTTGVYIASRRTGAAAFAPLMFYTNDVERIRIATSGYVGIGTTSPQALLSVGDNTSNLVAIFGGGTGKINAGTVDPIYTIGGQRYATYLPAMTGQKEETTGVARLRGLTRTDTQTNAEIYGYTIDFNNLEKGSDLWLFSKVTDLKNNFDKLVVLLTPSFDGRVWYEKDSTAMTLTIFGSGSGEVSYRLTASRFDAASWPNISSDPSSGFIITD